MQLYQNKNLPVVVAEAIFNAYEGLNWLSSTGARGFSRVPFASRTWLYTVCRVPVDQELQSRQTADSPVPLPLPILLPLVKDHDCMRSSGHKCMRSSKVMIRSPSPLTHSPTISIYTASSIPPLFLAFAFFSLLLRALSNRSLSSNPPPSSCFTTITLSDADFLLAEVW